MIVSNTMQLQNSIEKDKIKVDILMITRNHKNYIQQAVESVLAQSTSFKIRLVIGDDASTDGTSQFLSELGASFPNLIQVKTQSSCLGIFANFQDTLKRCNAEYVALLEGDDYWTDTLKLQKQIDFLDQHPDIMLSTHAVRIEKNGLLTNQQFSKASPGIKITKDLFKQNFPTAASVFRRSAIPVLPEWFPTYGLIDWPLWLVISTKGKMHLMKENMAVYRCQSQGFWTSKTKSEQDELIEKTFSLFAEHNEHFRKPLTRMLKRRRAQRALERLKDEKINSWQKCKKILTLGCPEILIGECLQYFRMKIGFRTNLRTGNKKFKEFLNKCINLKKSKKADVR